MNNLNIQNIEIARIREYKSNPKLHNWVQIAKIRESIREFGSSIRCCWMKTWKSPPAMAVGRKQIPQSQEE